MYRVCRVRKVLVVSATKESGTCSLYFPPLSSSDPGSRLHVYMLQPAN